MVSQLNYDKNILKTKSTSKTVEIVHFYKPNDYSSKEFEKFSKEY